MSKKRLATEKRRARRSGGIERTVPTRSRSQREVKDPVTKALKADFDATHVASIRALRKHDFEAVARGIDRERELIDQQRARIDAKRAKQATHIATKSAK